MGFVYPILFLAALYNLVLVVIILVRTPAHRGGRTFAWYILGTAAWMCCVAIMHTHPSHDTALHLARATFLCVMVIAVSGIWFCADFPFRSAHFRRMSLILTLLALPWLYFIWTPLLIADISFEAWGVAASVGPLVPLFTLWIVACGLAGSMHLLHKLNHVSGLERLQIRYILLGMIGLVASSIPVLILPVITGSSRYASYGSLSSLFVTTTTTYAIVRYRLMDIKIVLRAGLVYSATIGTLSLLFAFLVPVLDGALAKYSPFPRPGSFIMAFIMALAFQPLRRYVQHVVDTRFFKSVYDYRLTLREAGSAFASARDREILVETFVNAMIRTLRPRGVAVYLPGNDEVLTQVSTTESWQDLPRTLSGIEPILSYAMDTDEVLVADELICLRGVEHDIGLRLKEWGMAVAIPLIAGDRLCGIVFLGERLSSDVYTTDDIGLLRILGKQAAIALDNARHYDEMVLLNEYHERLLHSMQDGVIAIDPRGRVITFNPAAEFITGVSSVDALGRRLATIGVPELPTHDTGEHAVETVLTKHDGSEIPVLVTVTRFRRRWDVADGHLIVFRDLSTLRALEQEKLQAERFSSMGAMAASLAHEIKNPLVPIQTFAHLLPQKYDDPEFREEFGPMVVKEVERISRLVGQMLDLVRRPSDDRGQVDLREVIERLIGLIQADCERHHVRLITRFAEELPAVNGMVDQLYQALLNVLMNAVQAMPHGGDLSISVEALEHNLICRIADSGPGVPPDDLRRIFEPLFTTKTGGHGLGLALTFQFVRSHGGEIRAECPPGSGLVVTIILPAVTQAEAELLCI
ncbi:MAG TPA: ATP-binding protein [Armatimonadota bacterium]|jgi:PAS domain S-box-containing protein